jgi:AcrR family transcriptional regulator
MESRRKVELLEKHKPRQERAKRTYEGILAAAAELLVEVGVERISTNLIAERAGITVPALYRYFPNKYAVLHALGCALMDVQNEALERWFLNHVEAGDPRAVISDVYTLFKLTYDVTLKQTGGLEIAQALRAVGPLQELRLASHQVVSSEFAAILAEMMGRPMDDEFALKSRISIDIGYGIVELALEDTSLDPEAVLRQGAEMVKAYWRDLIDF